MADPSIGQEMHKMSTEHFVVPEIKEVLQKKTKKKETNSTDGGMSGGRRGQLREPPRGQSRYNVSDK